MSVLIDSSLSYYLHIHMHIQLHVFNLIFICTAIPSSLQNDSIHLHSVTDKPSYVKANNSSIMENGRFANHTFKPDTIPEEEADANKNASIFIETEDILDSVATVEATDYASER